MCIRDRNMPRILSKLSSPVATAAPSLPNRLGEVDAVAVCSELSDEAEAALIRFLESKRVTLEDTQKEVDNWNLKPMCL